MPAYRIQMKLSIDTIVFGADEEAVGTKLATGIGDTLAAMGAEGAGRSMGQVVLQGTITHEPELDATETFNN